MFQCLVFFFFLSFKLGGIFSASAGFSPSIFDPPVRITNTSWTPDGWYFITCLILSTVLFWDWLVLSFHSFLYLYLFPASQSTQTSLLFVPTLPKDRPHMQHSSVAIAYFWYHWYTIYRKPLFLFKTVKNAGLQLCKRSSLVGLGLGTDFMTRFKLFFLLFLQDPCCLRF